MILLNAHYHTLVNVSFNYECKSMLILVFADESENYPLSTTFCSNSDSYDLLTVTCVAWLVHTSRFSVAA